jgi:hypothetical protein
MSVGRSPDIHRTSTGRPPDVRCRICRGRRLSPVVRQVVIRDPGCTRTEPCLPPPRINNHGNWGRAYALLIEAARDPRVMEASGQY